MSITVRELKKILANKDDDAIIVVGDSNGYAPLEYVWIGAYSDGRAGLITLTADDIKNGYSEEDIVNGIKALFLVPSEIPAFSE